MLRNDVGFTLIETLTVTVILGALAAIAIPSLISTREHAWQAEATSVVRSAAVQLSTLEALPTDQAAFDDLALSTGPNVALSYASSPDGLDFCLQGAHAAEATIRAAWASGRMSDDGACPPDFGIAAAP